MPWSTALLIPEQISYFQTTSKSTGHSLLRSRIQQTAYSLWILEGKRDALAHFSGNNMTFLSLPAEPGLFAPLQVPWIQRINLRRRTIEILPYLSYIAQRVLHSPAWYEQASLLPRIVPQRSTDEILSARDRWGWTYTQTRHCSKVQSNTKRLCGLSKRKMKETLLRKEKGEEWARERMRMLKRFKDPLKNERRVNRL